LFAFQPAAFAIHFSVISMCSVTSCGEFLHLRWSWRNLERKSLIYLLLTHLTIRRYFCAPLVTSEANLKRTTNNHHLSWISKTLRKS
jgi:hypothetical protein